MEVVQWLWGNSPFGQVYGAVREAVVWLERARVGGLWTLPFSVLAVAGLNIALAL